MTRISAPRPPRALANGTVQALVSQGQVKRSGHCKSRECLHTAEELEQLTAAESHTYTYISSHLTHTALAWVSPKAGSETRLPAGSSCRPGQGTSRGEPVHTRGPSPPDLPRALGKVSELSAWGRTRVPHPCWAGPPPRVSRLPHSLGVVAGEPRGPPCLPRQLGVRTLLGRGPWYPSGPGICPTACCRSPLELSLREWLEEKVSRKDSKSSQEMPLR